MHKQNTRKQQLNRGKNTSTKNSRRRGSPLGEFTLVVPRNISTIIPDRFRTTLKFWISKPVTFASDNFAAFRFRPTGAQSVDPLVADYKPLGFAELARLYNSYRVKASSAKVEVVNTGLIPVTTSLLPSNTDPGTSPTADYVVASRVQPYAVSDTGALVGGPVCRLNNSMRTQKMFGSKMTQYDDNFAALVNTVPANNWFWVVTLYSATTGADTSILNFYCEIEIEFYDRAILSEASS